jgi:hypothetical protein
VVLKGCRPAHCWLLAPPRLATSPDRSDPPRSVGWDRGRTNLHPLQAGLVDEMGGLARAVAVAKQLAGLPEEPGAVQLLEWPPRKVPPALALLKSSGGHGRVPLGGPSELAVHSH